MHGGIRVAPGGAAIFLTPEWTAANRRYTRAVLAVDAHPHDEELRAELDAARADLARLAALTSGGGLVDR